jgi:hypothetical protein
VSDFSDRVVRARAGRHFFFELHPNAESRKLPGQYGFILRGKGLDDDGLSTKKTGGTPAARCQTDDRQAILAGHGQLPNFTHGTSHKNSVSCLTRRGNSQQDDPEQQLG